MIYSLIVPVLLIAWFVASYNGFIKLRNRTDEAWSDIEIQLKRRFDLIPNLVETVKGYATHEKTTLDEVVEARSKATQINIDPSNITHENMQKFSEAQAGLSQTLGKLLALSESYPDLKANQNFMQLTQELSDTENKIQSARRFFNGNARDLNIKIESFPSNIIAKIFHFSKKEFFDIPDNGAEYQPVAVKF